MSNTIDITRPSYLGIPQCVNESISINNDLAQCVGTDARWLSALRRSMTGEVAGECYRTDTALPQVVNMIKHGQLLHAKLTAEEVSADRVGRAVTQYRYRLQAASWRALFPTLDFLMCPILQGITDADLDNGKCVENIAGTHPVTLTTSSRYLYPDKRLVHIDDDGYMVMRADGVDKYERLWSNYPYNMWGAVTYPSHGHYCVAMVYEQDPHKLWTNTYNSSGVELQQNNQNWSASGMYHYKSGSRANSQYYAVNATSPTGAVRTAGTCVLIYNINIDADRLPETYVYIRNVTTGVTHYDLTRTGTTELTPPGSINIYWRCVSNNHGRVKWFGVLRGTQDEHTITMLKTYLLAMAQA